MDRARWRARIFPLAVLLMTALLLTAFAPVSISAGLRAPAAPSVDCRSVTPAAAARSARVSDRGRFAQARVQAQFSQRGELTGRVLTAQTSSGAGISLSLPVESSVAPAAGSLVIYTRNTPQTGSEVHAVNLDTGCDTRLASPSEIVRGAVLNPSATALYVHSVTKNGRQDAGITRVDLASGVATQVIGPLPPSIDFGPTFGTSLHWSVDGKTLAVQSCGIGSCRTRVLDVAASKVVTYDSEGQGDFIGLTADHLVTFADCPGEPRPVLSTDLASGAVTVLSYEAYSAAMGTAADGHAIVAIQTAAGTLEVAQ